MARNVFVFIFLCFSTFIQGYQNDYLSGEHFDIDEDYYFYLDDTQNLMKKFGDVKFYLFNRNSTEGSEAYTINGLQNISSTFSSFSREVKTKLIIHGWKNSLDSRFNIEMRNAYLPRYNYNVIIVDWSDAGSKEHPYMHARLQVPYVADQVAAFIDKLCSQYGIKPEDLHVVGHSLGAHVAGLSGRKISSGKIGRITGLDPAQPGFSYYKPEERISIDSGTFVDIIHTCGGYLASSYELGHADFFPNNGRWIQPGCWLDVRGSCSHRRSYEMYVESIKDPKAFVSTPCQDWSKYKSKECNKDEPKVTLGEFTSKLASGSYYLRTNKESPYSKPEEDSR